MYISNQQVPTVNLILLIDVNPICNMLHEDAVM